jgi:hypothetical protein
MTNYLEIGTLAGIVACLGFVPYIIDTLKGRIKPSIVTWFIWSVIGISSYLSYLEINGWDSSIWVPMSYMIGPIIITTLCLKRVDKTHSKLDIVCLILSLLSLLIGYLFNQFYFSLLVNILADSFGVVPTFKKSYEDPYSESLTAWILFLTGNLMNLFMLTYPFSFQYIYPIYLTLVSIFIVGILSYKRLKIKKNQV